MADEVILNNVIRKPVFGFNFSTLMLFRCLPRKYAEPFLRGKIYFGSPEDWIAKEEDGNKGQGDILEGVFFSVLENDSSALVASLKADPTIEHFTHNGFLFFRRKSVLGLRCLCLYGLNDNSFQKTIGPNGKAHYSFKISKDYFSSFSETKTREDSEKVDKAEQPVVIFINNPHEFFSRVRAFLHSLDVKEEEIIISPVEYFDRYAVIVAAVPPPTELLLKDTFFAPQSEIRIIINSTSPKYIEYMRTHDNIINIGSLKDLAEVFENYYEDMYLERLGGKRMLFTLPNTIHENIRDMDFIELVDHLLRILRGEVVLTGVPAGWDTLEKQLKPIADLFHSKFGVTLHVDEQNRVSFRDMSDEQQQQIQERYKAELQSDQFNEQIDQLIKQGKIEQAKSKCLEACKEKMLLGVSQFCLGKLYALQRNYEEAVAAFQRSFDSDYKRVESLSGIAGVYFEQGKYEKAIEEYNSIQDEMGYDTKIWSNIGISYIHLKQYEKAIECFDKGIAKEKDNAFPYYNKGVACFMLKQLDQAKACMEKAIELDPSNDYYKREYSKCFSNK